MASDHKTLNKNLTQTNRTTILRWPICRRIPLRRRRQPTVRLGGKKPRRGLFLVRLYRRVRLRWLKLSILKKLKDYYRCLVKELIEASATMESYQQRLLLESSFAIPVMGLSLNNFPNNYMV